MAIYKNLSFTTKTFYGVTFKPGEVHEVAGYINHPKFMRLNELPKPKAAPKKSVTRAVDTTLEPDASTPKSDIKSTKTNLEEVIPDGEHSNQ